MRDNKMLSRCTILLWTAYISGNWRDICRGIWMIIFKEII